MPKFIVNNSTLFCMEVLTFDDSKTNYDELWCKIHLKIENYYLKFDKIAEYLMPSEVKRIIATFEKLQKGELKKETKLYFAEPEISFSFQPSKKIPVKKNWEGKKDYVMSPPSIDISIEFPNDIGVYCCETWTFSIMDNEIELFYNQLVEEVKKAKRNLKK